MNVDEAMSWSLPPEEVATFLIPGMFGLSRQEAGGNSKNIKSYYWGRMNFTQTTDYMGVLPWLLLPLALMYRRDKYTLLALAGLLLGLLFSMGKYTQFYWILYEHFPGINHFRVPKMMMIIPALSLGVLGARGLDALMDDVDREKVGFRWYLRGLLGLALGMLALWVIVYSYRGFFTRYFIEILSQPTRYEQGFQLVTQRWDNICRETAIASLFITTHIAVIVVFVRRIAPIRYLPIVLLCLFLTDVWRINDKFMLLQSLPMRATEKKTAAMEFMAKDSPQSRVLPLNNVDPMKYASQGIPVMYTSNPVMMQSWQEFLEAFSLTSAMPDILNVRYIIVQSDELAQQQQQLGSKYEVVFQDPIKNETVLINRNVLPKAWLVSEAIVEANPEIRMKILGTPALFDPSRHALVEASPNIRLTGGTPGVASVTRYHSNNIAVDVQAASNALLVLGEKYYRWWYAEVDGKPTEIVRVNHVLRGVYVPQGAHKVEFRFDPLPFKIGKYLTLTSFAIFVLMLIREFFYVLQELKKRKLMSS